MPLVQSTYRPGFPFRNGHASTIYSALLRKPPACLQVRERLELADGDFLDLDWSRSPGATNRVLVLLHGLEGNAQRPYMLGSARLFSEHGFDVCAVNLRGCSGEPNRLFRSYHSGATDDLDAVVRHISENRAFERIYLKGFSLGGNLILKYLGEERSRPERIAGAAAISVPCELHDSLRQLNMRKNSLYSRRFLKSLREKALAKHKRFPELLPLQALDRIRSLQDFDDLYTSRAHGFEDALDYYRKCSCRQFLRGITVPTLLINARNDSFLGPDCYPVEASRDHAYLYFESPDYGGHVGFVDQGPHFYSEKRSLEFLESA